MGTDQEPSMYPIRNDGGEMHKNLIKMNKNQDSLWHPKVASTISGGRGGGGILEPSK